MNAKLVAGVRRGAGLLAVASLNLVVLVAYTLPRRWSEAGVEARIATANAAIESGRQENERLKQRAEWVEQNRRDERQLLERDLGARQSQFVALLNELEGNARDFSLRLGARDVAPEELEDLPITRVEVKFPVEGSYGGLVAFLRRLEHSRRFLTIDEVALQEQTHGQGAARATALEVSLSAYFKGEVHRGEVRRTRRGR